MTGVKKGSATITAKAVYGNKTESCLVNVADSGIQIVEVTGVSLVPSDAEITIGKSYRLKASVLPENATNKLLTWTSSNENVATVSDGVVTAKALGTATITVKTVSGGFSKDCMVTVIPKVEITSFTCNNMNGFGLISLSTVNVPDSASVYLSAYNEDGQLLSVQPLTLSGGSTQTILPLANIQKLKAFIWNTSTLKPLADAKELELFASVKVKITKFSYSKSGNTITASLSAVNVPDDAAVYLAEYDSSGNMLAVQRLVMNGGSATAAVSSKNASKLKAFIWSADSQKPIVGAGNITIK